MPSLEESFCQDSFHPKAAFTLKYLGLERALTPLSFCYHIEGRLFAPYSDYAS